MLRLATLVSMLVVFATAAPTLSPVDNLQKEMKKSWLEMDQNNDGVATFTEFRELSRKFDSNGDNKITLDEYTAATQMDKHMVALVFKYEDQNNNGVLDEDDVKYWFTHFDVDGNGSVNENEFSIAFHLMFIKIANLVNPMTTTAATV